MFKTIHIADIDIGDEVQYHGNWCVLIDRQEYGNGNILIEDGDSVKWILPKMITGARRWEGSEA